MVPTLVGGTYPWTGVPTLPGGTYFGQRDAYLESGTCIGWRYLIGGIPPPQSDWMRVPLPWTEPDGVPRWPGLDGCGPSSWKETVEEYLVHGRRYALLRLCRTVLFLFISENPKRSLLFAL